MFAVFHDPATLKKRHSAAPALLTISLAAPRPQPLAITPEAGEMLQAQAQLFYAESGAKQAARMAVAKRGCPGLHTIAYPPEDTELAIPSPSIFLREGLCSANLPRTHLLYALNTGPMYATSEAVERAPETRTMT